MGAKRRATISNTSNSIGIPVLPVRDSVHFPGSVNTLIISREISRRAFDIARRLDGRVLVVGQNDVGIETPTAADLHPIGTLSEILQAMPLPDGGLRVALRGLSRAQITSVQLRRGSFFATIDEISAKQTHTARSEALRRECLIALEKLMAGGAPVPFEALEAAESITEIGELADHVAHHLLLNQSDKHTILDAIEPVERAEELLRILHREDEVLAIQNEVRARVDNEVGKTQRDYYLREQLKIIQKELNDRAEPSEEGQRYLNRIESSGMPETALQAASHELARLEQVPYSSPESVVIRSYLDWLISLPWNRHSNERLEIAEADEILNRRHFGLDQVKERILDYLAVRKVSQSLRSPILCFIGPPGVGKTSIGKSVAEAMGRKFARISLGGLRDEAEIRGHRRTYVGAMPGRIIQAIRQVGVNNPVIMLDEIDKMGSDFRGDPASALLEALDPEQNSAFMDHYIDVPFDLSHVVFITTANLLEPIPRPLYDRLEVIRFSSYTPQEKQQIAKRFLIPNTLKEHGITARQVQFSRDAVRTIIEQYTREAGVRALQREIAMVCRKVARRIAEGDGDKVVIAHDQLEQFLGIPKFRSAVPEQVGSIGVATGLVYTDVGGETVPIEVCLAQAGDKRPEVLLTGRLGDVMKESAMTALTFVRSHLGAISDLNSCDVHVHVPEGAVSKDGPSAGITIAAAIASAVLNTALRIDVAMTGEITLRGRVLAVGGVREKVLAAHRAGIKTVVLPADNAPDLAEIPIEVRKAIRIELATNMDEVLALVLEPNERAPRQQPRGPS